MGFRLSTGSPSYPSSGWSSLSDDFRRDAIAFDRAYVNVQPTDGLQLRFGFNANPLFPPTELVWDGDVSPGGVAEVIRSGNLELVAGQFMLREIRTLRSDNRAGGMMWAHGLTYRSTGEPSVQLGAMNARPITAVRRTKKEAARDTASGFPRGRVEC